MRTSSTKNSLIIGLSIVLGASLLSVGVSSAASSSIKACAKKSTGAMRLIDSGKKCKSNERTLTWGAKGTTGAKGARGATGARGSNGTNGVSSVLVKTIVTSEIAYNSPSAALSANVPAGKYSFQFSAEAAYFNNSVATLKTRYLACLITTNSDGPTAQTPGYASSILWPEVGSNAPIRTSFAPSAASGDTVSAQTYAISGVLNLATDSTIYLQCQNENDYQDPGSAGQLVKFFYPTFTFVKTDQITTIN
jgi:hypothetical protein